MTDYNTAEKKRNTVVGGFVIIGFAAFMWMVSFFGELPVAISQLRSFNVIANFPSAPGIQQNTAIMYCGYQVGRVVSVSPPFRYSDHESDESYHQIKVTMGIDRKYVDIPSHVDVKVIKRSMGSSYIDLQVDLNRHLVPLVADRPESVFLVQNLPPLQGSTGVNSEFFPKEVQKKLENLVDSLVTLSGNANEIIGDVDNKTNIKKTLANVTAATLQAKETLASIKGFSDSGTDAIEGVSERLNDALCDLRDILAKVNEGEGTAGQIVNDGRLYEDLLDSSSELQMALEQLKNLAAEARKNGIKLKL